MIGTVAPRFSMINKTLFQSASYLFQYALDQMQRDIPVTGLRAFEVAARHPTLKSAAEELGVTTSAISHQIRFLETNLGVMLFDRSKTGIRLTSQGEALLPDIRQGFALLETGLRKARRIESRKRLAISMLSTFAIQWFVPRMQSFQQLHPTIDLQITTSIHLEDFKNGVVDCAIRFGEGTWVGLQSEYLLTEHLTPFCSPEVLKEGKISTPRDLRNQTLIHSRLRRDDWRTWLYSVEETETDPDKGPVLETRTLAIAACRHGQGLIVTEPRFVMDDVRNGLLVQPFTMHARRSGAYYLVYPKSRGDDENIVVLSKWLRREAEI